MINIAIVEDTKEEATLLEDCVRVFGNQHGLEISTEWFHDAESFLSAYRHNFDVILMDIELPGEDGLSAATKLREIDAQVILIFVTNMAQYAIKGYGVNALDYILKPIKRENFCYKLERAIELLSKNVDEELVIQKQKGGLVRISTHSLQYVEVAGHKLSFFIGTEPIYASGSLTELEKQLSKNNFMRCNNCYLVNPKYIKMVDGHTIKMQNGGELQISHPRRKAFMAALAAWLGKGNFV